MRANRMNNPTDDFRRDFDAIKDDIALLRNDLAAALRDLFDAGRSEAGDVRNRLENAVRERLRSLGGASGLADQGRRAAGVAQRFVKERPLESAAIAIGAGLLLAAMLRRR
jgi:ElaB/YqjD/DUF883 family membrane-anchored ribosome-binding protein